MPISSIPRPEYPRPQFVRPDWLCLNGEWQFEIDKADNGRRRGLLARELRGHILVPFCPESPLSGVHHVDFMNAVWYRRTVTVPGDWTGRRVLLHFQAVDYDATVWANGVEVGRHRGGFTPFTCDLSGVAAPGQDLTIVVRARDNNRFLQPRGKQSRRYENYGCLYNRTTGIWQTVWLEPVPQTYLRRPRLTPQVAHGRIRLEQPLSHNRLGWQVRATLSDGEGVVSTAVVHTGADFTPTLDLDVPAARRRLWSPRDPHLYDLEIELLDEDGLVVDRADSYAGLRSVTIDGKAIKINGETIFQRLVLDQGFYADGIMTAPSDDALCQDIELSLAAGFNGARLHQKVFEERFLYHADRMGYLVWGEFADWGCRGRGPADDRIRPGITYVSQWLEALERDYSHPCIVGWCPLNETPQPRSDRITTLDDATQALFLATKALDQTRPVLDVSGYSHRVPETDVYDSHDYTQDPEKFARRHAASGDGNGWTPYVNGPKSRPWSVPYRGQPYFVSEFGGIWWNPTIKPRPFWWRWFKRKDSWGYGRPPLDPEEFYRRFEALCSILLNNSNMFAYCYTQLTDVFQEQNGIYTFDRQPKFDLERLRRIQQQPAAIEQLHLPES